MATKFDTKYYTTQ